MVFLLAGATFRFGPTLLLGGVRGFRSPPKLGCYVTKSAPHKAFKLIAWVKLTFDKRVVLHRVVGRATLVSHFYRT